MAHLALGILPLVLSLGLGSSSLAYIQEDNVAGNSKSCHTDTSGGTQEWF